MAEVFISYSQKDRALVAPIAARLTELGVDAWYDREISAGQSFGAIIRARLKEAKAVLVCWSPDAIDSQWVDAEADFAREMGTYVPVFIAPCALMPPFNRIHTDDLSKWSGAADDSIWIKLVDRLAHLIGRAGLAAAARALATTDEAARYDFARRCPDEPVARNIWAVAEVYHRQEFGKRLAEARAAAAAKINADRAMLDDRLRVIPPAFEAWLADESRGAAKGPKPDPMGVVEPDMEEDAQNLRHEIAALSNALAQAKAREGELKTSRAEIERLTGELSAERATSAARHAAVADSSRQAKALKDELDAARAEIERLLGEWSAELTASAALHVAESIRQAEAGEGKLDAAQAHIGRLRAAPSEMQSREPAPEGIGSAREIAPLIDPTARAPSGEIQPNSARRNEQRPSVVFVERDEWTLPQKPPLVERDEWTLKTAQKPRVPPSLSWFSKVIAAILGRVKT